MSPLLGSLAAGYAYYLLRGNYQPELDSRVVDLVFSVTVGVLTGVGVYIVTGGHYG